MSSDSFWEVSSKTSFHKSHERPAQLFFVVAKQQHDFTVDPAADVAKQSQAVHFSIITCSPAVMIGL